MYEDVGSANVRRQFAAYQKNRWGSTAGLGVSLGGMAAIASRFNGAGYYSLAIGGAVVLASIGLVKWTEHRTSEKRETEYDVRLNIHEAFQEQLRKEYKDKTLINQEALKYALKVL